MFADDVDFADGFMGLPMGFLALSGLRNWGFLVLVFQREAREAGTYTVPDHLTSFTAPKGLSFGKTSEAFTTIQMQSWEVL